MSGPRILRTNYIADEAVFTEEFISGLPSEGVMVANSPGGFLGTSFQPIITNDVNGMGTYLNSNYSSWKVCDGSEFSDVESPIWGNPGRHLPNLVGGRFLRGAASVGGVGGANSHTLSNNTLPSHNHGVTINSNNNSHTHGGINNQNELHSHTARGWTAAGGSTVIWRRKANIISQSGTNVTLANNQSRTMNHTHTSNSTNMGHGHTINTSVGNAGGNSSLSTLPAYTDYYKIVRVK